MMPMCAVRLSMPFVTASRSSWPRSLNRRPPCSLVERTVVTSTAALGANSRKRQDRHHFRRRRDDEAGLAGDAVRLAPEAADDESQLAIVHVEGSRPEDRMDVDPERVAVVDRRVDGGGEQVVCGRDRGEIAVE